MNSSDDVLVPISPGEASDASLDPGWAEADPDRRRYLALDLGTRSNLKATELERLRHWLSSQPVPVIGVGAEGYSALESAVDLVVAPGAEYQRAVGNILRNPQAASMLVQVLRACERGDVMQALTVESLGYATLQAGEEFARWLHDRRTGTEAQAVQVREDIVLLERDAQRLRIVLNSPQTRNSMSSAMRDALVQAFKLAAMDPGVTLVEVSGNGPCFSVGGELEEFGTLTDPAQAHRVRMLRMPGRYIVREAPRYHFYVHRACIGAGIEMPAFAGHVSAAPNTFFQLPEVTMGLIPGAGGCVSIPRRIGRRRTAYMTILNKKINAKTALEWGLIDAIEERS
ncbi:MAG: enoyl-CoA hydratase-related protein [Pseudomonadales bacterium]|nr:enoyl-CoA hydratase-related protein [Pseudomonadales bacterium]MDP6472449.1 enoyl-CoA hydratase-related protein [Pseudomonadales bacterium]MDP6828740.1 enoyl-CoA hydratase-related protein [Pseudomonadales bacterium]MDP6971463.1 enoyl-CoA hydratase-related protein [Pseudomonadales bacterium]